MSVKCMVISGNGCHTKVTEGRVGTDVVVEPWIMIVLTPHTIPLEITSQFSFQTFVLESEMI